MRAPGQFGSPGCFPIPEIFCVPAATAECARSSESSRTRCWCLSVPSPSCKAAIRSRWWTSENKVSIRTVKVGDRVGNQWIIADGLKPGERVVAEGVQKVRPGMQVNPKPFAAETAGR